MFRKLVVKVPSLLMTVLLAMFVAPVVHGERAAAQEGTVLIAERQVVIRASPPEQRYFFLVSRPGPETAKLEPGDTVKVESFSMIKVPFDEHTWVKVKAESGIEGWVYYGDQREQENFIVK